MESVTFIVADTGERLRCQLNPERLVTRRTAGLRRPVAGSGPVTGPQASDDPLLHIGGGRTEMDLELLFDIETSSADARRRTVTDVRDLTRPLWQLAENPAEPGRGVHAVRFCWGLWNVLCVVAAVAERLERFDTTGAPTRSWLSLRLVRIPDPTPPPVEAPETAPSPAAQVAAATSPSIDVHVPVDPGRDDSGQTAGGERLDAIAARYYGAPWLWRVIAAANGLYDSVFAPPGTPLTIPEAPAQP